MLKQIKLRETNFRTIKAVHHDGDSICLVFYSGEFALARKEIYQDNDLLDEVVSLDPQSLNVWWPPKLIELGVMTKEEYESAKAAHEQVKAERELKWKREQLERLQKELGQ